MSDVKWTPGPWRVATGKDASRPVVCRIVDAVIKSDELPSRQSELADAHLIAAAPELYKALLACIEGEFACTDKQAIAEAEAALAKARGNQNDQ